ncbi:MAG: hypothetical protein ABEH43_01330, partial [Flavobacteriales bacterium]
LVLQLLDNNVEATANKDSICTGDSVQLNVNFLSNSKKDDFENETYSLLWYEIKGGNTGTFCGADSGNALYFDGTKRLAETAPTNLSNCNTLSFCFSYGSGASPCEQSEEGEAVTLEFSTDNGNTWNKLKTSR